MIHTKQYYHNTLAGYYSSQPLYRDEEEIEKPDLRKLAEQPWQQIKAGLWDEVTETLCNIFFIEGRIKAGLLVMQQEEFEKAISLVPEPENKRCLDDFYSLFMFEKHILKDNPELTFQQFYNELQWKKDITKKKIEKFKNSFLSKGRLFIHQFREPLIVKKHLLMTLTGHSDEVSCCAYSPDGLRIVSGSHDNTLIIWDANTGKEILVLKGHTGKVTSCAFSPDGKRIVSGSSEEILKIWDSATGNEIGSLKGIYGNIISCSFSKNGKNIISVCELGRITLWDTERNNAVNTLNIFDAWHNSGSISSFDSECILCSDISPEGDKVVTGCSDFTLKVWDLNRKEECISLEGHLRETTSCAFSHDGSLIVSGGGYEDNSLSLWDATNGNRIRRFQEHNDMISACSFSGDGKRIVSGSADNTVIIWDSGSGEVIATLNDHIDEITSCSFSPDRKSIVSGSKDKTIKIRNTETSGVSTRLQVSGETQQACAFSADGKKVVFATPRSIKLLNIEKSNETCTIKEFKWDIETTLSLDVTTARAISPDCEWAALHVSGKIIIYNTGTGDESLSFDCNDRFIKSIIFSPDSRFLLCTGHTIKLWDLRTGNEMLKLDYNFVNQIDSCAFSSNSKQFITCSFAGITIWDIETANKTGSIKGYESSITSCNYSPDGNLIVYGSGDGTIKIWDLENMIELKKLIGHRDDVISCTFSPDGKYIISGSNDKTLKIWDAKSGIVLSTFFCDDGILTMAVSWCGTKMYCFDRSGKYYLLNIQHK